GSKLKIPCQFPGARVQRNDAVGKKIVAGTHLTRKIWTGIADTPVDEIKRWVIASSNPSGATSGSPGIAPPRLVADFARTRNGVELPKPLPSSHVEGSEKSANTELTSRYPNNYGTIYNEWRSSQRVTIGWVCHLSLPDHLSIVCIDSH